LDERVVCCGDSVCVTGVPFDNLTVQGRSVTTQIDADATWNISSSFRTSPFQ
jgi:hypothetical protein